MKQAVSPRSAVLSVGRLYCDLVFTGVDAMPVLGRELFARDLTIAAGGGAFIAAAHVARLGRCAALVSRLGTDCISIGLEDQLARSGADLRFVERAPDAGPQMTVVMVHDHERAFLSRRAGTARPATLEQALDWSEARHLHVAEYATLNEIPGLIDMAKAKGLSVSLDPSWDDALIRDSAFLSNCRGADIFLPNMEEARAITGARTPDAALDELVSWFPVVAIKAGPKGAVLGRGERRLRTAAPGVPVVDTTGAGDAFNAGFIDAWLDGASDQACLDAGVGSGSLAVGSAGGAFIS
jgi:sugar/nucleoside kinase (ribokinase family)